MADVVIRKGGARSLSDLSKESAKKNKGTVNFNPGGASKSEQDLFRLIERSGGGTPDRPAEGVTFTKRAPQPNTFRAATAPSSPTIDLNVGITQPQSIAPRFVEAGKVEGTNLSVIRDTERKQSFAGDINFLRSVERGQPIAIKEQRSPVFVTDREKEKRSSAREQSDQILRDLRGSTAGIGNTFFSSSISALGNRPSRKITLDPFFSVEGQRQRTQNVFNTLTFPLRQPLTSQPSSLRTNFIGSQDSIQSRLLVSAAENPALTALTFTGLGGVTRGTRAAVGTARATIARGTTRATLRNIGIQEGRALSTQTARNIFNTPLVNTARASQFTPNLFQRANILRSGVRAGTGQFFRTSTQNVPVFSQTARFLFPRALPATAPLSSRLVAGTGALTRETLIATELIPRAARQAQIEAENRILTTSERMAVRDNNIGNIFDQTAKRIGEQDAAAFNIPFTQKRFSPRGFLFENVSPFFGSSTFDKVVREQAAKIENAQQRRDFVSGLGKRRNILGVIEPISFVAQETRSELSGRTSQLIQAARSPLSGTPARVRGLLFGRAFLSTAREGALEGAGQTISSNLLREQNKYQDVLQNAVLGAGTAGTFGGAAASLSGRTSGKAVNVLGSGLDFPFEPLGDFFGDITQKIRGRVRKTSNLEAQLTESINNNIRTLNLGVGTNTGTTQPSKSKSSTKSRTKKGAKTPSNTIFPSFVPSFTKVPTNTQSNTFVPSFTKVPTNTQSNTFLPSFTNVPTSTQTKTQVPTTTKSPVSTLTPQFKNIPPPVFDFGSGNVGRDAARTRNRYIKELERAKNIFSGAFR